MNIYDHIALSVSQCFILFIITRSRKKATGVVASTHKYITITLPVNDFPVHVEYLWSIWQKSIKTTVIQNAGILVVHKMAT